MDESFVQMRDFMVITENLIGPDIEQPAIIAETRVVLHGTILEDLQDAVFKMRAFTESREGDLGLGIELGMQRAADMIDNVINRHQPPQGD
jgi:hypothetical protein